MLPTPMCAGRALTNTVASNVTTGRQISEAPHPNPALTCSSVVSNRHHELAGKSAARAQPPASSDDVNMTCLQVVA